MTAKQCELINKNHNMIYGFLKKHGLSVDDYYDLAAIGLCEAARDYDETKSKFSTYAYRCMWTTVMKYIQSQRTQSRNYGKRTLSYEEKSSTDECTILDGISSDFDLEKTIETSVIVNLILEQLSDFDRQILFLLRDGYSVGQIARKMNCNKRRVEVATERFKRILKQM